MRSRYKIIKEGYKDTAKHRVIDFIHRETRDTCSGKKQQWHPYRFHGINSPFLRVSCASTYSNFAPDEISVFGIGARINRRYHSCNWQSRENFWPVWNSFLRLYYDHLSFLTSRPRPWWFIRPDDEFVRSYHRQYHRSLMHEKTISYLPNVACT